MAISIIINTAILNIANQHQSTSIKTHDWNVFLCIASCTSFLHVTHIMSWIMLSGEWRGRMRWGSTGLPGYPQQHASDCLSLWLWVVEVAGQGWPIRPSGAALPGSCGFPIWGLVEPHFWYTWCRKLPSWGILRMWAHSQSSLASLATPSVGTLHRPGSVKSMLTACSQLWAGVTLSACWRVAIGSIRMHTQRYKDGTKTSTL